MKSRNYYVYGQSDLLKRLKEEYDYIGRDCAISGDRLTVSALPRKKAKVEKKGKRWA